MLLFLCALTSHPLHPVYKELQFKCILGDARLLYNLPAGFHSCLSDTQQTCAHTYIQTMPSGTERIYVCVWESKRPESCHTDPLLEHLQKQNLSLSAVSCLYISQKTYKTFVEAPSVSLYLSIPLSLTFPPLSLCCSFPTQNSISKLVPAR